MSEFESLTGEQREFERVLKELRPVVPQSGEADLIFRAGQDSARRDARRQLRRWQFSTLTASLCALIAFGANGFSSHPEPNPGRAIATESKDLNSIPEHQQGLPERNVVKKSAEPVLAENRALDEAGTTRNSSVFGRWWENLMSVSDSSQHSYLDLRNRVLEEGVDSLPHIEGGHSDHRTEPLISSPQRTRELLDAEFPSQI